MIEPKHRGAATVEMTLVGIPIIFTLISVFEISRGMWIYQTLAYSVKAGVRYGIVHGASCDPTLNNGINTCTVNAGGPYPWPLGGVPSVAAIIEYSAVGLDPQNTLLTFTPAVAGTPCYLAAGAAAPPFGSHGACTAATSQWPPNTNSGNTVGQPIRIDIQTPFRSAIAMFWPEAKRVSFSEADLGASSVDDIQF